MLIRGYFFFFFLPPPHPCFCRWKQKPRGTPRSTTASSSARGRRQRRGFTWLSEPLSSSATLQRCSWCCASASVSTSTADRYRPCSPSHSPQGSDSLLSPHTSAWVEASDLWAARSLSWCPLRCGWWHSLVFFEASKYEKFIFFSKPPSAFSLEKEKEWISRELGVRIPHKGTSVSLY